MSVSCYYITGEPRQHFRLCQVIVEHIRYISQCYLENGLDPTNLRMAHCIERHIEDINMELYDAWGTDVEIIVACTHLLGVNITIYSEHDNHYCVNCLWLVDAAQSIGNTNPIIYVSFSGNHFDVIIVTIMNQ